MKRKMQKRVMSFVMTLLMVIGLLPVDFLSGGVTEVQAADLRTEWIFQGGKDSTFDNIVSVQAGQVGNPDEQFGLIIDATNVSGPVNGWQKNGTDSNGHPNWVSVAAGAVVKVPVSGKCELTLRAFNEGKFTVDGKEMTAATQAFICEGTDGYVTIVCTGNNYIGSINVASAPAMAPIGTTGEYTFAGAGASFFGEEYLTEAGVLSPDNYVKFAKEAGNSQTLEANGAHGVIYKGNVSFKMEIPANSKVEFGLTKCQHSGTDGTVSIYVDGVEVSGTEQTIGKGTCSLTDTVNLSYINSSDNPVVVKFLIKAPSTAYLEKITYSVSDKPDTAKVSGTLKGVGETLSGVVGEKLWFKDKGNAANLFSATIQDDGTYAVDLPAGKIYSVYLSKAGYSIPDTAQVDLSSVSAGDEIENPTFEVSYSDPHKAMKVSDSGSNSFVNTGVFGTTPMNTSDAVYSGDGFVKAVLEAGTVAVHTSNHGIYINNNSKLSFMLKIPAQSVANFTLQACNQGKNLKATTYVGTAEDSLTQSGDTQILEKPTADGTDILLSYTNKTANEVIVKFSLEPDGGQAYLHGVKWECVALPQTATVTGSLETGQVAGGTLNFKNTTTGVSVTTKIDYKGDYSVELPVGAKYDVSLSGISGCKLVNAAVDLTSASSGATVPAEKFELIFWDAAKTATVTIGGTTFTIKPGADDTQAFIITPSGGDGSVEYAGTAEGIIWADLGGAGKGAVSNVTYSGATGTVSGNKITITFDDNNTLPESYVLNVKDNSASGVPIKDGATTTYNMSDGSVISTLYKGITLTGGKTITSTDKLVSFTANTKISYNDVSHGIIISDGDVVTVKVAGNATITFSLCSFAQAGEMLTATASAGNIYVSGDKNSNSVAAKAGSDGAVSTFVYEGEDAATLTFAFTGGKTGQNYIHSMTVTNEAEKTTTNESAVKVKPETLTGIGVAGNLTVTPNGQKLNFVQTGGQMPGGQNFTQSGVSFYAFPETADWNKLELEVKINSIDGNSNSYGAFVGAINTKAKASNRSEAIATVGVRNNTGLRGIYSKATEYAGGGQASATITAGDTVKYTIYKADDAFYIESVWSEGTATSKFNYKDSSFVAFEDKGAETPVYIGLVLAGVNADVMNMVYTDKDGNVLYDQNAYYNPLGEAPVAKTASAVAAADRTYVDVTWTGTQVFGDGKFVLQVSKDGGEWTDVSDTITGYSYQYPVSSDASGVYKFRVCGTLGNSDEQSLKNRNTYVESNEVTIVAALAAPVVTVKTVSPADRVNLTWTASPQATSYEVYRRSADEATSTLIATVEGTSYTDEAVTAEVPYYYYVIAKSADNFSNPQEEVWTLPTAGNSGAYQYDDAVIAITKKSYDTVFDGKITVEGVVTAPGKVSLLVNGTEVKTANVPAANETFSFTDVAIAEGRNDVEVILEFDAGKKVRKALNFVYLTNYDYVVDAAFTGSAGDTTEYGVPQYKTISEAIAAIGSSNSQRKVILIREGSYEERLDISTPYLSLIGEDSTKTIIHNYPGNYSQTGERGGTMGDRAAMRTRAGATGFSVENLTIQNDWEYKGDGTISNESADVIHNEAEGAMYVNVRFLGYQDTICANKNHQYYYKCYIAGNVDFIYGNSGMALFNDCDIVFRYNANKNSGYVTAMKNDLTTSYGALFNECRITGESGCSGTSYYLGRPWGEEAATTFIDCYMSSVINRNIGWTTWGGKEFSTDPAAFAKVRYYEQGSYGTGAMVNLYRRQLSENQAAAMLSTTGLGWDPYGSTAVVSSSFYVGSKTTTATDKVVTDTFVSDKYSAYEGDDTGLGKYNQEGYAQSAITTGGGLLKETNSNYYKVATAKEFMDALAAIQSGKQPSVIEITDDLNLGSNEIPDFASYGALVSAHNAPLTHPELLNSGVSKINLRGFNDLTIFSSNGSSINHASLDIRDSNNIIIRNITFDELWEWDEKDKGDYDTNDWDFVVIESGSDRIWIDHCTFYKAYDGVVDIKTDKNVPTNVTVSWCEFLPGSENNTFFNAMMDTMAANPDKYPYYKSLLDSGMTKEQIWWYAYGQKKTHLLGQNDDAVQNVNLNVTFANNYYYDSMDRMPRLRFGNAHVYNCIMDAQELYDARASITNQDAAKHIVSNGASSTCDGQLLLENCYINGIINALNSGNGSSPSGYINAVNSLYYIDGTRYALVPKVNTTKPGEQVKLLNADAFTGNLPYSGYALYDAAELSSLVVPFAGAGKLNLTVLQWEKSSYKDSTWVVPDDDSNHNNDNLPDFVETPDGVVVIGEGVIVGVGNGVTFKNNKGNIIKSGKIYVKAVLQQTSSLAGKINLGSEDKVQYYDVSLVDEDGNTVTIASGKLDLTFSYPSGTNRSDYSFRVYHGLDNKKIEQLGTSCIDTGIKVTVDSLSPFAIVYTENEDGEYEGDTVQSVKTGDSTPVVPLAVIMFISAGVCATFFFKKRKYV